MLTERDINVAYAELNVALAASVQATNKHYDLNSQLVYDKALALMDGTISGKNADERKAAAEDYFRERSLEVQLAQREVDLARLRLQVAENEVARVRALLRLAEVAVAEDAQADA